MTWFDVADTAQVRVRGQRHHAANLNAFTITEAEKQWFHLPQTTPPIASGRLLALSPQLLKGYGHHQAINSQRRSRVREIIEPQIGKPSGNEFEMVVAA